MAFATVQRIVVLGGGSAGFIHGNACASTIDDEGIRAMYVTSIVAHAERILATIMISSFTYDETSRMNTNSACYWHNARRCCVRRNARGAERSDSAHPRKVQ